MSSRIVFLNLLFATVLLWTVKVNAAPVTKELVARGDETITIDGKVYALGTRLGAGANGVAFTATAGEDAKTHVAKHYKPDSFVNDAFELSASKLKAEFDDEVAYTKAVGKLIASGQSKISDKGGSFSWIITPKVEGGPLTETEHYKATAKPGAAGCKAYLTDIHTKFVAEMEKLATQPHGLVHLDASDRNTFWKADGKTFSGFIDYGSMGKTSSAAYKKTVKTEGLAETASVKEYAVKRAALNYPIKPGCT